jgi:hypothetical protein
MKIPVMKNAVGSFFVVMGVAFTLLVLPGCTTIPTTARPDIRVETIPSHPQSVNAVRVYQQEEKLVVSGNVTSFSPFYLPGHVDIALCAPDGSIIDRARPQIFNHDSKGGGVKTARFTGRLIEIPPVGSTLRLKYHSPPFEQEADLNCL